MDFNKIRTTKSIGAGLFLNVLSIVQVPLIMATPVNLNYDPRAEIYDPAVDQVPPAQPIPVAYPVPPNMDPRILNSNRQAVPQYYFVHPNFYNAQNPLGQPVYGQQFVPQPQPVTVIEQKVETTPAKEPEPQIIVV